ncbi:T9SS sorting signal type C domain-containing protein [Flavobacterium sp. CYK-55]|uniref:T9SS sorting signal type C domain-containing protein n=1 Tax=Flavobacterium sp. CYK-55 TaxID=2835529 RepID=UPI001BCD7D49|nr:T9SS sorting signal type C domain-containing protein [Flavobacterium sp. CYK-55]MBS7788258.1 T9SS sorting signal type C domain-containing protein [Flavobacterium sp. CYK-55]
MKKLLQKSKLIDMALNVQWVVVMILLMTFQTTNAQSPVYFSSGNYANPNNWSQGSAASFGTIVGTNIHTTTPNGTGNQYFRMYSATSGGTTYEPNGASDILLTTGAVTTLQVTGSGKAYYLNIANASSNVVFKTRGSGAPGSSTIVAYEIQGAIQTITGVSQSPIASAVNSISSVTVTATLSGSLATGQGIWMRYTTNNYSTSTVVQLTGSGTTYTGTIPAQAAGANVSYYVFSSGTPASITGADADLATININNNGGSNYTYTVLPTQYTWNQTGTASWATAANWTPTRTTPAATDVLLFNNGATTTVNSVPTTQTIGGLLISNNTNVTFATSTAAALTIGNNVTGADLSVAAGSSLNVLSNAVQSINVATGATGAISGSMTFAGVSVNTAHVLTAADASGITFASGASFTQNTFNNGNVFGNGTANSVVFANGSTFNHFAGSNPFQKTQPASVVVFNSGSNYVNNQANGNGFSFSGRTYGNITFSGTGTVNATGTAGLTVYDLTINSGTFNLGMTTVVASIKGNISVGNGAALVINPSSTNTNINGTGIQTISTAGTGSISVASSSTLTVVSGSTVDMGTSFITGAGTFTVASGGTLRTANADGIYSSTATGSIRTTTRNFNTGANYVYNGTANQTTGTGLPATVASLTINNSGTSPANVVTLTNNCTTASVVLTAGKLDLNSKTLTVSSGGTVAATSGDFTATAGPVAFAGTGTVSGTVNFPTVTLAGGVNFGSASNIVTSLQINSGGFVNTNAPTYGSSSTLIYNSGGTYGRGTEWSATSGAGYPNNVQIQNGTTVDLSANGFADRAISGNLNLGVVGAASAGSLTMGATTNKLTVGGNLVIGGNTSGTSVLTLSSAIGGDIYLNGNWDTKTNGSYASNTRAVFFQGSGTSTVTTIGAATFDYLFVNKTSGGTVSLANDMTVNNNLTLNAQLVTNSFKLIIPTGNNVTANPSGWVRGNLQKNIPTGTNSRTFEIGDSSNYTPVTLDYSGVTGAGNVVAYTTAGDHAQISSSDIDPSFSVNRTYTLTNSGVTGGSYDATFNFVAGDVDSGAITAAFGVSSYVNPTWTSATVSTRTSTSTKATGLTGYGDFQLGETATTWTAGASTTDWATSGNWSKGVPSASINAIIPSASLYPEISATAAANRMSVASGASVTVKSGYNLTVTDAIANSGTITVENNANLKQTNNVSNTGSGTAVVKRNTATLMRQDYVMWSSPVDGQQLQAFSPQTLSTRFYTFDGSAGTAGQYVATSATGNFADATGYLIRLPNNHPATPTVWNGTFTGTAMHNGNYSLTSLNNNQYYAVGNPYPSTIDADLFIAGNSLADAMYFWRKTNNSANPSYATYTLAGGVGTPGSGDPLGLTPNGVINVGQGFIVKTSGSGTSLNFTNGMRITNNGNLFFRTNEIERNRIWLNMSNTSGIACQTMVSYMENATSGVDNMIDGLFLNDSQNALTSLINGAEYAIQGRALPFESTDSVALGFKSELPGDYSIALDHVDGFFINEHNIFLKDNLTATVHDLRTGAYTFTTAGGVDNTRFELVFENLLNVNPHDLAANQVIAYTHNNQLNIDSGAIKMAQVEVFDIRGRLIAQSSSINASKAVLNIPSTHQVLLVKITSENGQSVTKKVMN